MWVVGYQNLPYTCHDTNADIEKYYRFLKSKLRSESSCMVGRRVDWTITILTKEVHDHFWYKGLRKENSFVDNKKIAFLVVSALMKVCDIQNVD